MNQPVKYEVTYFAYHIKYGSYIKMIDTVEAVNVKDAIYQIEEKYNTPNTTISDVDILEVVKVED